MSYSLEKSKLVIQIMMIMNYIHNILYHAYIGFTYTHPYRDRILDIVCNKLRGRFKCKDII